MPWTGCLSPCVTLGVCCPARLSYTHAVPWYPKAILSVVAILTLALIAVRPLRNRVMRVNIRWLIVVHLTRFVGFYFLFLYAHHELPYAFAVRGESATSSSQASPGYFYFSPTLNQRSSPGTYSAP